MAVHTWNSVNTKVGELRSESLDSIAEIILDLEDALEALRDELDIANREIAELEK